VAGVEVKSVSSPDETRSFTGMGKGDVVTVSGHPVMYTTFEPGWRWSEHVKPIAGTEKCEAPHLLYAISGRMKVVHDDGTEAEVAAGDVASIEPEHDAWVVGEEPFVAIDFGGYAQYGQPKS
jgi:quercetin dioxygenase-like cupin family protein